MHISIHIGKDKIIFFLKKTSMPKYVHKAKLSYAHILQNPPKKVISCHQLYMKMLFTHSLHYIGFQIKKNRGRKTRLHVQI